MNHLKTISITGCLFFLGGLSFAQEHAIQNYDSCKSSYRELINSTKRKVRSNWVRVIKCFEEVSQDPTQKDKAQDSLMTLAGLYRHLHTYSSVDSDINNALRYYMKVIEEYPGSNYADDAFLARAKIYSETKKDYTKAYLEVTELLEKYPKSDSAPKGKLIAKEIERKRPKDDGTLARQAPDSAAEVSASMQVPKANRPQISEVKHWTNPDFTRVAIYLDSKAGYSFNFLDKDSVNFRPARLYVDIKDSSLSAVLKGEIPIKDGLLSRARIGKYSKDVVRIVLDAEKDFIYTVVAWEEPFRIIIDIKSKMQPKIAEVTPDLEPARPQEVELVEAVRPKEQERGTEGAPPAEERPKEGRKAALAARGAEYKRAAAPPPSQAPLPGSAKSNDFIKRVVIDAGHGGKDFGAVGKNGTLEKDVALGIAKRLRDLLSKEDSIEVIMTREDDTFIPLEERTGMAVQAAADLFISIHANAHKNRKVHGVSTYFLDDTDDQESIMTALKENYAGRDFVGSVDSKDTKDVLSFTFASLQKNYDTIRSIPLADMIHKDMLKNLKRDYARVGDLGVRKGVFWVLCGTNSPAVLVETSFVSNPEEEKKLQSPTYQEALARGIAEGIKRYIKNPVAMSGFGYLSAKKSPN